MKKNIKTALVWTIILMAIIWGLIPAIGSYYWGESSMIRFDPKISTDYDCIFVEGHSAKSFTVPWLSLSTPVEYLRIRYTPLAEKQEYGIMFIDPRTLAYEAHNGCVKAPTHLAGRLSSSQPILDWMRSQPHSAVATSHTNDANEIFRAIVALKSSDLKHFTLPANFPLQNFVVGHQSLAKRGGPNFLTISVLVLFCASLFHGVSRAEKSATGSITHAPSPINKPN